MAIFDRVNPKEFDSYGWFFGIVPVYVAGLESGEPMIVERNWCPEWWFSFGEALFGFFCWWSSFLNPEFEPTFPILLTGPIDG